MNVNATQPAQTSVVKKAAATVATAAVVTGTAMYLAKSGKLDKFVGKNAKVDTAINGLKGAADKTSQKLTNVMSSEACQNVANKAKTVGKSVADEAKKVGNFAADKFGKLTEGIRMQLGKFDSALAPAKAKLAETFNNFVK